MRALRQALVLTAFTAVLAACGPVPEGPVAASPALPTFAPAAPGPRMVASVLELMDQVIDPAADTLWASVATTTDRKGTVEHRPRSDADWLALRRTALVLVEATNLLAQPGRVVAHPGHVLADASAPGMLSAAQIQQALDSQHATLATLARGLQDAALESLAAIDKRDIAGLELSGGRIDEACEACHKVFWYPPAASAAQP
jgi:hypothetical protein